LAMLTAPSQASVDANAGAQYSIDSKAMRRVEEGQDLIIVAEFSAAGAGFILAVAGRILIKLH